MNLSINDVCDGWFCSNCEKWISFNTQHECPTSTIQQLNEVIKKLERRIIILEDEIESRQMAGESIKKMGRFICECSESESSTSR